MFLLNWQRFGQKPNDKAHLHIIKQQRISVIGIIASTFRPKFCLHNIPVKLTNEKRFISIPTVIGVSCYVRRPKDTAMI